MGAFGPLAPLNISGIPETGLLELVTDYLKAHPVKDLELQRVEINLVGHDKEGTA